MTHKQQRQPGRAGAEMTRLLKQAVAHHTDHTACNQLSIEQEANKLLAVVQGSAR